MTRSKRSVKLPELIHVRGKAYAASLGQAFEPWARTVIIRWLDRGFDKSVRVGSPRGYMNLRIPTYDLVSLHVRSLNARHGRRHATISGWVSAALAEELAAPEAARVLAWRAAPQPPAHLVW